MIRDFMSADLPAMTDICNYYIRTSTATFELTEITPEDMSKRINPELPALVVEESGRVTGYAYVHPWKERAAYWPTLELTVYLMPESCGWGIGRELVVELLERVHTLGGYHSIIACITADNDRSIRLFESLGFKQVSYFPEVGFKFGERLSVVDLILSFD